MEVEITGERAQKVRSRSRSLFSEQLQDYQEEPENSPDKILELEQMIEEQQQQQH